MNAEEVRRLVDALEGEVNNGGFDQLFFNSAGDEVAAMIEALEMIGATKTAAIVRRACARFPAGMPPMDRAERQTLLLDTVSPDDEEAFEPDDDDFLLYEEDLAALVADFASRSASS
jgi:hypothetical protein